MRPAGHLCGWAAGVHRQPQGAHQQIWRIPGGWGGGRGEGSAGGGRCRAWAVHPPADGGNGRVCTHGQALYWFSALYIFSSNRGALLSPVPPLPGSWPTLEPLPSCSRPPPLAPPLLLLLQVFTITVPASQEAAAQAFVRRMSPTARLTYSVGGTLKFELPTSEVSLAAVFGAMGEAKQQLQVLDWGVANATLEEVFIKFARQIGAKAGD